MSISDIWGGIKALAIRVGLKWWMLVYVGVVFLVYLHFFGFLGAATLTVLLILLNTQIHKL